MTIYLRMQRMVALCSVLLRTSFPRNRRTLPEHTCSALRPDPLCAAPLSGWLRGRGDGRQGRRPASHLLLCRAPGAVPQQFSNVLPLSAFFITRSDRNSESGIHERTDLVESRTIHCTIRNVFIESAENGLLQSCEHTSELLSKSAKTSTPREAQQSAEGNELSTTVQQSLKR